MVMTASGGLVEVQGTAEGAPFSKAELDAMMALAAQGITRLQGLQQSLIQDPNRLSVSSVG